MSAQAQTYLVNALQPKDQCRYQEYKSPAKLNMMGYTSWQNGFVIGQGPSLIASDRPGDVTYKLNGKYDKLTFALGHYDAGYDVTSYVTSQNPGIVTVTADGRKILDCKLYPYSTPKRFTLDVSGVDELKFSVLTGDILAAFGEVTLWAKGQTPTYKGNLPVKATTRKQLVKDIMPYARNKNFTVVRPDGKQTSITVSGKTYQYGLDDDISIPIIGYNEGHCYFSLNGAYDKMSFIVGPAQTQRASEEGSGWLCVAVDGKTVKELEIRQKDMAQRVVLDIKDADVVSFYSEQTEWSQNLGIVEIMVYPEGDGPSDTSSELAADPRLKQLPDVCKLISNIQPYQLIGGERDNFIFDGKSDYITFSMGGMKFSEGLIFTSSANILHDHISNSASFDLGGEFDYLSFIVGHLSSDNNFKDDVLEVVCDGNVVSQIPLRSTHPNCGLTIPLKKCRKLELRNVGSGSTYGVADMTLYRGEPCANNLFPHAAPDFPDEARLISQIGMPYMHYVSGISALRGDDIIYDGSTQRRYFDLNGERIYEGIILKTTKHFSLEMGPLGDKGAEAGLAGGLAAGMVTVPLGVIGGTAVSGVLWNAAAFLMLAAGGEAIENSFAAFNTYGQYNTVTFSVACLEPENKSMPDSRKQKLMIGADREVMTELAVSETMEPTTVTVPINGCNQLLFWLDATGDYMSAGKYLIYDITVSKQACKLVQSASSYFSNAVVTTPEWNATQLELDYKKPDKLPYGKVSQFLGAVEVVRNEVAHCLTEEKILTGMRPEYEIHTFYLQDSDGKPCKAVQLRSLRSINNLAVSISSVLTDCGYQMDQLQKLQKRLYDLKVDIANATLSVTELGIDAVKGGKEIKKATKVINECTNKVNLMIKDKKAEMAFLESVLRSSSTIDGVQSTENTALCPIFKGEQAPAGNLQLVKEFDMK